MQHLFCNTVAVLRRTAHQNSTGENVGDIKPVSGLSAVKARIAPGSGRKLVQRGQDQVVSSHTMFTSGDEPFVEGDFVVDESNKTYEILFVKPCFTLRDYHHTECDLIYRQAQHGNQS